MSFLRHKEIYPCDEGRDLATAPPLIAVDEPPAGYSWQVALQQSPEGVKKSKHFGSELFWAGYV